MKAKKFKKSPSKYNTPRVRMLATVLCGVFLFSVIMYWRDSYLAAAEYVDFYSVTNQSQFQAEMRSQNYQLDTQDLSPAVR